MYLTVKRKARFSTCCATPTPSDLYKGLLNFSSKFTEYIVSAYQPLSQGPLSYSLEREKTLVEAGHVSPCDK